MKRFLELVFFVLLFHNEVLGQMLLVKDQNQKPIPYFTVTQENGKKIWVGNQNGELLLSELGTHICGLEIRHVGYVPQSYCENPDEPKRDLIEIVLEEGMIDLEEVQVSKTDEDKILKIAIQNFNSALGSLSYANGQYLEKTEKEIFQSFGLLNFYTPIDRTNKVNLFNSGRFGFIHEHIRLFNFDESEIPYKTHYKYFQELINDVLWETLNVHNKSFEAVASKVENNVLSIYYEHVDKPIKLTIAETGLIKEIQVGELRTKSSNGHEIELLELKIRFLHYKNDAFFNEISLKSKANGSLREMFLLLHSFPVNVTLPPTMSSKKDIDAYFSAVSSHSSYPDVSCGETFFDLPNTKFYSNQMVSRINSPNLGKNFAVCYVYHEKMDDTDPLSKDYVRKSNEFAIQLLQSLKDVDLTWQ